MTSYGARRIVTGLNAEGKSCVVIDGPVPAMSAMGGMIWRSAAVPADNSGTTDTSTPYTMDMMHDGGTSFMVVDFPPNMPGFMHATDTLDYVIVLKGEVVLELEAGEVTARVGDFIVDRGIIHSWRNVSDAPASIASIIIPAHPVGTGRTV